MKCSKRSLSILGFVTVVCVLLIMKLGTVAPEVEGRLTIIE